MRRLLLLLPAVALVLAACSSSSHSASKATTTSTSAASSTSSSTAPPSSSSTSSSASTTAPSVGSGQKLTVTPSSGLSSPATVHVLASGFSPHENLLVIECANKGASTAASDCNLQAAKSVSSNSSGVVSTTFTVVKGPFGTAGVVCNKPDSCLVSVTQATPSPKQEADAPISFS